MDGMNDAQQGLFCLIIIISSIALIGIMLASIVPLDRLGKFANRMIRR